jgi:hypothetical protein
MISVFDRTPDAASSRWFDEHAQTWVERGLVSAEQVDAIRTFERTSGAWQAEQRGPTPDGTPDTALAGTTAGPRISLVGELAVYLGSVVALMSGTMMVGEGWDSLGLGGRVAIGVAVAALGFVAGARLVRFDDAPTRRLASFMWLIGTGGVALAAATLTDNAEFEDPGWNLVIIGLPVLAIGAAMWRNLNRPLQVLTTAVGFGFCLGGVGALLSTPPWVGGILIWATAVVVGALAVTQRLRPELYVLGVAAVAAMIGALMLTDITELAGSIAATITAAGIVAVGLWRRLVPILVIGVLAFLQSLAGLLMTTLNGALAAMVVALAGLAVVIAVIVRSTRQRPRPIA